MLVKWFSRIQFMKEHDMMIVTINLIYFIYQLVVSIKVLLDIKLIDLRY